MQNHGILVYMECADGQPVKAGLEALNAAQRLAAQQGGKPWRQCCWTALTLRPRWAPTAPQRS